MPQMDNLVVRDLAVKTSALMAASMLVAGFTFSMVAEAADPPTESAQSAAPATEKKPEQHIMMDHSVGDTKAMARMKDRKVPVHTAGDPAPPSDTKPGEEHIMMDHSKADVKSMSRMKDKTVPVHKAGEPVNTAADKPCQEHIMMDHSKADAKSMARMKDKNVPVHKSGNCPPEEPATSAAAKPKQ
jgi:hypothetical protein